MKKETNNDLNKKSGKNKTVIIIAAVIAVIVAVVLAVVFAVNSSKGGDGKNVSGNGKLSVSATDSADGTDSQGGSATAGQNPQQPSAPSQGEVPKNEDVIFTQGSAFSSLDQNKKDAFVASCVDYGIDSATAKSISESSDWKTFEVMIKVTNTNSKDIAAKDIKVNNIDGIKLSKNLGVEYGIPSGKSSYVSISIVADSSKYGTEDAVAAALNGMNVQLAYTLLDDSAESVEDWSKVDLKYMALNF